MSHTHLTPTERGQVQALMNEGKTKAYIARVLGRHRSTITREIKRNARTRSDYDAAQAQQRYRQRRQACLRDKKLAHPPLWRFVLACFFRRWSPEQIAGYLARCCPDDPRMRISHETIYRALYADERLRHVIQFLAQARSKRRRRGQGKTRRGPSIPNRVGIEHRPKEVDARSRYGDWEGDTVVGANQQAHLLTLVERKSGLLLARRLRTKQANEVALAATDALSDMPLSWLKTATWDNGTEFAQHETIAAALSMAMYFARPYASYQRGTNENTNGLIRRYLPKGTDFRTLTQEQLDDIVQEINDRPRKRLGYRTPNEIFLEQRHLALVAFGT